MFDFSSQVLQSPTTGWRLWHSDVHKSLENVEVEGVKRARKEIDIEQWRLVFAKDEQEYDVLRASGHNLREVRDRKLRVLIVHVDDIAAVLELQKMLREFVAEPEPEMARLEDFAGPWKSVWWYFSRTQAPGLGWFTNVQPNVQNSLKPGAYLTGTRISPLGRQLVYGHGHSWAVIEDKWDDFQQRLYAVMGLVNSRAKTWERWASKFAQSPLESSQGINGEEKTWRLRRTTRPPATSHSASGSRTARRRCWSRGKRRPSISGS